MESSPTPTWQYHLRSAVSSSKQGWYHQQCPMHNIISAWQQPMYSNIPVGDLLAGRSGRQRTPSRMTLPRLQEHEHRWQYSARHRTTPDRDSGLSWLPGHSYWLCLHGIGKKERWGRDAGRQKYGKNLRSSSWLPATSRSAEAGVKFNQEPRNTVADRELLSLVELLELDPDILKVMKRRKHAPSYDGGDTDGLRRENDVEGSK